MINIYFEQVLNFSSLIKGAEIQYALFYYQDLYIQILSEF